MTSVRLLYSSLVLMVGVGLIAFIQSASSAIKLYSDFLEAAINLTS